MTQKIILQCLLACSGPTTTTLNDLLNGINCFCWLISVLHWYQMVPGMLMVWRTCVMSSYNLNYYGVSIDDLCLLSFELSIKNNAFRKEYFVDV